MKSFLVLISIVFSATFAQANTFLATCYEADVVINVDYAGGTQANVVVRQGARELLTLKGDYELYEAGDFRNLEFKSLNKVNAQGDSLLELFVQFAPIQEDTATMKMRLSGGDVVYDNMSCVGRW